jgi:hypothetical protein
MCLTIAARLSFDIGLTNVPSHDYTTTNAYKKSMSYMTSRFVKNSFIPKVSIYFFIVVHEAIIVKC